MGSEERISGIEDLQNSEAKFSSIQLSSSACSELAHACVDLNTLPAFFGSQSLVLDISLHNRSAVADSVVRNNMKTGKNLASSDDHVKERVSVA